MWQVCGTIVEAQVFRRVRVQHEDTDMRQWALVDVISVLGQGLALSAPDQPLRPTLQCAA